MKVGTDGVLVGAWARVLPDDRRMLDIGTGTGVIALMLAQRTAAFSEKDRPDRCRPVGFPEKDRPEGTLHGASGMNDPSGIPPRPATGPTEGVRITGIDIGDISEARENTAASPWSDRVELLQCPVQEFRPPHRFDLIVSNPPFFVDSLTCPDRGRTTARHAVELPFEALRDSVVRLLADGGRFAAVFPVGEGARFEQVARDELFVSRRTWVRTTPRRAPKRVLLEFVRQAPAAEQVAELTVGTGAHEEFTPEYRALTRDFYLKF